MNGGVQAPQHGRLDRRVRLVDVAEEQRRLLARLPGNFSTLVLCYNTEADVMIQHDVNTYLKAESCTDVSQLG